MSSLWTPGGEHEVPRDANPSPQPETPSQQPPAAQDTDDVTGMPGYDELTPDQQAQAQAMAHELAEARVRLMDTPAGEVVANHAMGLYELAAIHLGAQPPSIDEAKVAIDAMTGIVTQLPGRLGDNETVLREALQQLQLAFVQLSNAEGGVEQVDHE
jgi:hypothetical protein